jgi:anti-sigma factor RsiW
MKECVEEGILQSYFDGELSIEMMEKVGRHLTSCVGCKRAARELEQASLVLSEALEPEFALSVPTDRLRSRIDAAIAERRVLNPARPSLAAASTRSSRRWFASIAELFTLSPQRALAYGGVAAVLLFALTFAILRFNHRVAPPPTPFVAVNNPAPAPAPAPTKESKQSNPAPVSSPGVTKEKDARQNSYVAVNRRVTPKRDTNREEASHVQLLPGERSYLKTIAKLDNTIRSESNKPMRPALQSEFERNLAMVDRAIAATRSAAKQNPSDPDAAEFMFAAYQNKVDLLNQVAEARLPNRQQ